MATVNDEIRSILLTGFTGDVKLFNEIGNDEGFDIAVHHVHTIAAADDPDEDTEVALQWFEQNKFSDDAVFRAVKFAVNINR